MRGRDRDQRKIDHSLWGCNIGLSIFIRRFVLTLNQPWFPDMLYIFLFQIPLLQGLGSREVLFLVLPDAFENFSWVDRSGSGRLGLRLIILPTGSTQGIHLTTTRPPRSARPGTFPSEITPIWRLILHNISNTHLPLHILPLPQPLRSQSAFLSLRPFDVPQFELVWDLFFDLFSILLLLLSGPLPVLVKMVDDRVGLLDLWRALVTTG